MKKRKIAAAAAAALLGLQLLTPAFTVQAETDNPAAEAPPAVDDRPAAEQEIPAEESSLSEPEGGPVRTEAPFLAEEPDAAEPADAAVHLNSAADFARLAGDPAGYYILDGDIDFDGQAWPKLTAFSGTLDGGNHTLSGLDVGESLLGDFTGSLLDITIAGLHADTSSATGILADTASGARIGNVRLPAWEVTFRTNNTIQYVDDSMSLATDADPDHPGIGVLIGTARNVEMQDVSFSNTRLVLDPSASGSVYGAKHVGLLAGDSENSHYRKVSASGTEFHLPAAGAASAYLGGLVGRSQSDSFSEAASAVRAFPASELVQFGGLVGRADRTSMTSVRGEVALDASGGVIGVGGLAAEGAALVLDGANGSVVLEGSGQEVRFAGGLVGSEGGGAGAETSISNADGTLQIADFSALRSSGGLIGPFSRVVIDHARSKLDAQNGVEILQSGGAGPYADRIGHIEAETIMDAEKIEFSGGLVNGAAEVTDGSLKADIDIRSGDPGESSYVGGIAGSGIRKTEKLDVDIHFYARGQNAYTGGRFIGGMFGRASEQTGSEMTGMSGRVDFEFDYPDAGAYSFQAAGLVNGKIETFSGNNLQVKQRFAAKSMNRIYMLGPIDRFWDNDLRVESETVSGEYSWQIAVLEQIESAKRNRLDFKTRLEARQESWSSGGVSERMRSMQGNEIRSELTLSVPYVSSITPGISDLGGEESSSGNTFDLTLNTEGNTRLDNLGALALDMTGTWERNAVTLQGELQGMTSEYYYGYARLAGNARDLEIRQMTIDDRADIKLNSPYPEEKARVAVLFNEAQDKVRLSEIAYHGSKYDPLLNKQPDDTEIRDSYFFFDEGLVLNCLIGTGLPDSYEEEFSGTLRAARVYLSTPEYVGFLLDSDTDTLEIEHPVADLTDPKSFDGFDRTPWERQTTAGIDSPRLTFAIDDYRTEIAPAGRLSSDRLRLSWTPHGSIQDYRLWKEGDRSSVRPVAKAEAELTIDPKKESGSLYKATVMGAWGAPVQANGYLYRYAEEPAAPEPTNPGIPDSAAPQPVAPSEPASPARPQPVVQTPVSNAASEAAKETPAPGAEAAVCGIPDSQDARLRVFIDCEEVQFPDAQPYISHNRVMIPLRFIYEDPHIQNPVYWNPASRTAVTETPYGETLQFTVGKPEAVAFGRPFQLELPPILIEERVFLSLRAYMELLGADVIWNKSKNAVEIRTTEAYRKTLKPADEWQTLLGVKRSAGAD
ncbi:stalk domain-containing protein [Saccharibacillus sp. CPCC 101409]|uniref:stalk domain-containing protein n=1 Tax=Saccharibacillus sp. CPCC 101409 TaxID=3058041 RepID=UPI0026733FB9|nr:stalk domain-containing protein [Saccharibacillus sp. CPCC 101409]MDO3412851.1 stalk domain-containing protein [Saccharibacillus sp. CPCC 101409]